MARSIVAQVPASVRGVIGGIVALSMFDLFISSSGGIAAFGWVSSAPASWLQSWLDPTKPLITDQRTSSTSSGTSKAPNCSGLVGLGRTICESGGGGSSGKCIPLPGPGGDAYCQSDYTAPTPTTTLPTPVTSNPLYV